MDCINLSTLSPWMWCGLQAKGLFLRATGMSRAIDTSLLLWWHLGRDTVGVFVRTVANPE